MKPIILLAALALVGCESLNHAGTSSLSVRPLDIGGQPRCCAVDVRDGKQYASLDVVLERTGDDYRLKLSARGVEAFRGQELAAGAAQATAAAAAKAAATAVIAPAAIPAAGAAVRALTQ